MYQPQAMFRIACLLIVATLATALIAGAFFMLTQRQLSSLEMGGILLAVSFVLVLWQHYLQRHKHARRKLDEMRDSALW